VWVAVAAAACTVGPPYRKPPVLVPDAYKEQPANTDKTGAQWNPAQPRDTASRGAWWEAFGDPALNALESQVAIGNQDIALAEARFRASRAAIRLTRADLFPTVTGGVSVTEARASSTARAIPTGGAGIVSGVTTIYNVPFDFSYEADLWGRVRRNVESSVETAQASAADLATALLSIQAELAIDYFELRGLDAQRDLLVSTVAGYEKALQLTVSRRDQGVASGVDVAQAETQLATVRAQTTDLGVARSQLEHAIAVLVGRPPAGFAVASTAVGRTPPAVPDTLPSQLLERRPDIAASERRVAAANALVGAARAAFFPSVGLTIAGGFETATFADWLNWPSRFWSIGPSVVETIFDGGRRRAQSEQARANYDATVATYRQSVLGAFADVEDNVAALRILAQEATEQDVAVRAAEHALALAVERYQGGITTYLEVITAQTTALSNERTAVDLQTRRMAASVSLIKALGGGWAATDLPTPGNLLVKTKAPVATVKKPGGK
jgi:NodT family efflux transporter outer membrane factor (OMF) lipoprotein